MVVAVVIVLDLVEVEVVLLVLFGKEEATSPFSLSSLLLKEGVGSERAISASGWIFLVDVC